MFFSCPSFTSLSQNFMFSRPDASQLCLARSSKASLLKNDAFRLQCPFSMQRKFFKNLFSARAHSMWFASVILQLFMRYIFHFTLSTSDCIECIFCKNHVTTESFEPKTTDTIPSKISTTNPFDSSSAT